MALKLTVQEKNALDSVLALVGTALGFLASNASALPADYRPVGAIVGLVGGWAVADVVSIVDTGTLPATLPTQLELSWALAKPFIAAQVAKLPADQQTEANLGLAVLDRLLAIPQTG